MSDTIYCGRGKKQKDNWRKVTLCVSNIPKEWIYEYNGKKYVNININDKDAPDQWGKDISVSVDTYKPDEKKEEKKEDDLPF